MTFSVYNSDPAETTRAGFGKVARLPCIFDSRPGYHRLASKYLIDRGLGIWRPVTHGRGFHGLAPSDKSILNYANYLTNFLDWAETREIDLTKCDYVEHVHGRYQPEMLVGAWSRDGRPLKPATINSRVEQACDDLNLDGRQRLPKNLRSPV